MGIDIGTLPWSEDGHRYFLLMVDLFTRYIEVQPLKDRHAKTLVEAFEQGPPVHFERPGTIGGETFREFCRALGVNKKRTPPYRPQADGMPERNIGMVKQVIRCIQQGRQLHKGAWPALLTEV